MLSAFYSSFSSYLADCHLHSQPAMDLLHSGAYVMREDGSIVAAAREFGECVMHACTCAGEIVNLESDDFLQACGIRS